jgi:cysteine synthase
MDVSVIRPNTLTHPLKLKHMNTERNSVYIQLENQIGNTPLIQFSHLLPNNNTLLVKLECENPWAYNHYVRVYLALFKSFEAEGKIQPGQRVYDFTSGTAGIAMAAIGTQLGYRCEIAIPGGGEKAREQAILAWIPEEQLHRTDPLAYIAGAPAFTRRFLAKNRDCFFLNHSMMISNDQMQVVNEVAISACAVVADDIAEEVDNIDVFVAISGNGTTQYGYGKRLKELFPDLSIVGCEAFESGYVYDKLFPARFEEQYGMSLDMRKQFSRHRLPGTTFPATFGAPALEASLSLLSDEKMVWDSQTAKEYEDITGKPVPENAIFWNREIPEELHGYGRTTWVGYKVAQTLAQGTENQRYLIVAYDRADRYDR